MTPSAMEMRVRPREPAFLVLAVTLRARGKSCRMHREKVTPAENSVRREGPPFSESSFAWRGIRADPTPFGSIRARGGRGGADLFSIVWGLNCYCTVGTPLSSVQSSTPVSASYSVNAAVKVGNFPLFRVPLRIVTVW